MSFGTVIATISSLIILRILVEDWLSFFEPRPMIVFYYEMTHFYLSLLFTFLLFVLIVQWAGKMPVQKAAVVALFGFCIVITPPLIDAWIAGGAKFWNFYKFDGLIGLDGSQGLIYRFFTLFGDRPDVGVTYGVRLEILLSTLFLMVYTWLKTRNRWRAVVAGCVAYSTFFVLGTLPSWLTLGMLGFQKGFLSVTTVDVARVFLTPEQIFQQFHEGFSWALNVKMSLFYAFGLVVLSFILLKKFFSPVLRIFTDPSRLAQLVYHAGLVCAGILLGCALSGTRLEVSVFSIVAFLLVIVSVWLAWWASAVVNDIVDIRIDKQTNQHRLLPTQDIELGVYKTVGWTLFISSLIVGGVAQLRVIPFLVAYQALAWVYSAWPLRLKRVPIVGTLLAATAGMVLLNLGFSLGAPGENTELLPASIQFFLLFALTLVLAAKDFKDQTSDAADGVYTLPVVLGEEWARFVIGGGVWVAYLLSLRILHEPRLLLISLICGSASFWCVLTVKKEASGWLHFRTLPAWLFVLAFVYVTYIEWLVMRG